MRAGWPRRAQWIRPRNTRRLSTFSRPASIPEARTGFEAFLAAHPQHELASNAQYWLGEVFYVERNYDAALAAFAKVLGDYPQARKAPDALLKTGYCHYESKRYVQARAALRRVITEYQDSSAARDAEARLSRMATEGR